MKNSAPDKAHLLHDRIRTALEWLGNSASRAVRDALLAEAGAAVAKGDVEALAKLLRQVHALARSVGTPVDDVHLARRPTNPPPSAEVSPSPPHRWSGASKPVPFPRRRDQAPLRYPWGEEPPPRPRSPSDVVPGKPEHLLPADCRERLAAYRRSLALRDEERWEACQLHGRVRYNGADEPPEWYWPAEPD